MVEQTYQALLEAFQEAETAWGDSDGRHALPQAVQLRLRIRRGEQAVRDHPDDTRYKSALLLLRRKYSEAISDRDDAARCTRWQAAYDRFRAALAAYMAAVKKGEAR